MNAAVISKIARITAMIRGKVGSFFAAGHERTIKTRRNVAISLILKGCTVVISLLLVPMTIHYVNVMQYGIWLTLSSMIAWFNFTDVGLANGLKNKIAQANAHNEANHIREYISTTYAILLFIATFIFILSVSGNIFLDWGRILNFHDDLLKKDMGWIALIISGTFCIQFFLQPLSSMLAAFQAGAAVSVIFAIGQFGCLGAVFLLTRFTSGSLLYLVLVLTCIPLMVQVVATIWCFRNTYASYRPSWRAVNLKRAKSLLSTGGAFFFVQIGSLLLFQKDNIIVSQLFGPQQVTIFNSCYKMFSVVSMVFTIAMMPLWPAFTDAYAKRDISWISGVFVKMYKYFYFFAACTIVLLIFSQKLFDMWLGASVVVPLQLSIVMAAYIIGLCWMTIHCYFLNGIGTIRLQLYLYIFSTAVNIPIAIYLGHRFGLVGVTISNLLIVILMSAMLQVQCKKIVDGTASGVWIA